MRVDRLGECDKDRLSVISFSGQRARAVNQASVLIKMSTGKRITSKATHVIASKNGETSVGS